MGLILDTSVLIAGERGAHTVKSILARIKSELGEVEIAISAISVVELSHGIYRAKTELQQARRKNFCHELFRDIVVQPVSTEIAEIAGRIEGELAAAGIAIALEDLLIGATALSLEFGVATLNIKDFRKIAGLQLTAL